MRSQDRVLHHYRVERELADRLRRAGEGERRHLYTALYNELFRRVPDHPQILNKQNAEAHVAEAARQFGMIKRFLQPESTYLELGPGDCALALMVCSKVARVYALDVSDEIAERADTPSNFQLIISDGTTVPVPEKSIDIVYSNQLMEHLHVDDVKAQLEQIGKALRSGGVYICITPNSLCGPHDISAHFDTEPTGFHMKEYSNQDLLALFREAGFRQFKALVSYKSLVASALLPMWPFVLFEKIISTLPRSLRKPLAKALLAVKFVAIS